MDYLRTSLVLALVLACAQSRKLIDRAPTSTTTEIDTITQFNCSVACEDDLECDSPGVSWYVFIEDDPVKIMTQTSQSELGDCEHLRNSNCITSILEINVTSVKLNETALQCGIIDDDGITVYYSLVAKCKNYETTLNNNNYIYKFLKA